MLRAPSAQLWQLNGTRVHQLLSLKKAQFSIYLLAQINNKENGIWLEGSIFLIPQQPHLPDGNVDAWIAQLEKTLNSWIIKQMSNWQLPFMFSDKKFCLGELWINPVNSNSYHGTVWSLNCTSYTLFPACPAATQAWLQPKAATTCPKLLEKKWRWGDKSPHSPIV